MVEWGGLHGLLPLSLNAITKVSCEFSVALSQFPPLPGLKLGDDLVYPAYHGRSILNIPASLCAWFGIPPIAGNPLEISILEAFGSNVRCIVLVLMDALAFHRLERWMREGPASAWSSLAEAGLLTSLTSIVPSTTSAALTSLWTGRSAAEHGITGYEMWLKEYGIVANTILHAPIAYQNDAGSLEKAGFSPEKFVSQTTLGPYLLRHGVKPYALQHKSILRSGLSASLFRDVECKGFFSAADLWVNLRDLMELHPDQRMFVWIYWSEVDHFGHLYGPDDERTAAEFANFSYAMRTLFLDKLKAAAREETLFILMADHGQVATNKDPHYEIRNHPNLMRRLHLPPTGENRLVFLYPRPGQVEAVREYVERTWPSQFSSVDSAYAVEAGLFGPGAPHASLLDRLGDMILVAQKNAYLWWAEKENHLRGRHGGLHAQEMLVPFLACRLG